MIVTLTDKEYAGIGFWASRGYGVWDAIQDSLVALEDDQGEPTGEYGVDEGEGNETAEAMMEAYQEELDSGHDPFQGVPANVAAIGRKIVDHMDYGLNYGFEAHDWE